MIGRIKQTIMKLLSICLFFTLYTLTINAIPSGQLQTETKQAVEDDLHDITNTDIDNMEAKLRKKLIQQLKENEGSIDNNTIANNDNVINNKPNNNNVKDEALLASVIDLNKPSLNID